MNTNASKGNFVAVRLDETVLARLDALLPQLSQPWLRASRSDALREVILRGVEQLERANAPK